MGYKIEIGIQSDNPNRLLATVKDEDDVIVFADSAYVDSCAGLGGYDLAALEDEKRRLKKRCDAFVKAKTKQPDPDRKVTLAEAAAIFDGQIAALVRDATRYRMLRDRMNYEDVGGGKARVNLEWEFDSPYPATLDEAIERFLNADVE